LCLAGDYWLRGWRNIPRKLLLRRPYGAVAGMVTP
jgi:hypothetical protein